MARCAVVCRGCALCGDRLLLLSADKGYTEEEELFFLKRAVPAVARLCLDDGQLSRLAATPRPRGGLSLTGGQLQQSLKRVGLLFGRRDKALREQFADTVIAFHSHADDFGPYDFYTHASAVREPGAGLSMDGIFTLLRLSRHDPNVVLDNAQRIIDLVPTANDQVRRGACPAAGADLPETTPIGRDLPFELGRIYLMLNRPRDAIRFNEMSLKLFGEHAVTWSNQALCYHNGEDDAQAPALSRSRAGARPG